MKKIIATAGGLSAAVLTIVLYAVLATAETGDAVYVTKPTPRVGVPGEVTLDSAQKTAAIAVFDAEWSGLSKTDVTRVHCFHDLNDNGILKCDAVEDVITDTDTTWALELSGQLKGAPAPYGEDWQRKNHNRVSSTDAAWTALTSSLFSLNADELYSWKIWRDSDTPSIVYAEAHRYKTAPRATYFLDKYNGRVSMLLGEVE